MSVTSVTSTDVGSASTSRFNYANHYKKDMRMTAQKMKAEPFDCAACGRRIGPTGSHTLVEPATVLCGRCVDRWKLHATMWPECHDLDHRSPLDHKLAGGTRAGIRWFLSPPPVDPPEVVALTVSPNPSNPGSVLVTIVCPYCEETHTHGGPGGDYLGHRSAHCWSRDVPKNPGYILIEATS